MNQWPACNVLSEQTWNISVYEDMNYKMETSKYMEPINKAWKWK